MLRAHTARCVPCAQFQSEAVAITHKLRLTPLEPLPAPMRCLRAAASWAGCCRSAPQPPSPRSRPDRGFALDLTAADEPHRTVAPSPRRSSRLPTRRAPGPPQHPPLAFRSRVGLDPGRTDI